MPTHYPRDVLERELDWPDVTITRNQRIIDTTAIILTEPKPANLATVAPHDIMLEREAEATPHLSPWRAQRRVLLTMAIILGALGSLVGAAIVPGAPSRIFTVAAVVQGNLTHTVSTSGTINANTLSLHFATGGQIAAIDVQPGEQVQAGQLLAQLNTTVLQAAVTTQQQQVTTAQADYRAALVALQNARSARQSADAVAHDAYTAVALGKTPPSVQQLQLARDQLELATIQAQNQVNIAQAYAAVAQAQIALAQTQLVAAQHALTHADLIAPSAGQIGAISGNIGATVSDADPIITLVDLTTLHLTALVKEADIGTVNSGWPVVFTVPAFPQDTFYGTVTGISLLGQTNQQGVSYPVTIAIAANSANHVRLFPGMTASITMTTQEAIGAMLVPNTALAYARAAARAQLVTSTAVRAALAAAQHMRDSQPGLTEGTANFVLHYQQGTLRAIPVVTGISDGTNTVILAGLDSDQAIVIGDNQASTIPTSANAGG